MNGENQSVIAQDWYEFDPGGWNYIPDEFTSYHLSVAGLAAYVRHLQNCNERYGFIAFGPKGEPCETEVDETLYDQLLKSPGGTIVK